MEGMQTYESKLLSSCESSAVENCYLRCIEDDVYIIYPVDCKVTA